MTRNLKLLSNFVEQFLGTVKFGNDQIASILSYGDLVQGNSTCYIHDLKGNDLLIATSSQAWLWHHRLSHLYFDTINLLSKYDIVIGLPKFRLVKDHLCSSCELGKAKRKSFKTKTIPSSKRRLQILHMDLCGPIRVEIFNEVLIDFIRLVQRGLHAQVRAVQTDKGTNFLNKTLHAYFAQEGIENQTSTAQTPKQNGVVERRNRTLVEATRTMLSAAKVHLFYAKAISTSCFTQNRSLIIRDGENFDKRKEKGDACIFVRYSTQSRAYRVYNKRTRVIVETIHVNFDKLLQMASNHVSSEPVPKCPKTALEQDSLNLGPQSQENVPQVAKTVTMSNKPDLLFSLMFDELLNGTSLVVPKSFAVTATDAHDQC
nr:hypothetical protein [Tanacetum cinerariifolium]